MPLRILALSIAFTFSGLFTTSQATTLDLAEARAGGAIVAEALSLGQRGDWAGAEAAAARSPDAVIHDIVLWRKLRAGAGTLAEYRAFIARRAGWPGQNVLARVVTGVSAEPKTDGLSGAALANWRRMSRLWRRDRFDQAERLLARISGDRHKLGTPATWAKRREVLARRAARSGRAELGYALASRHQLDPADGYDFSELEWLAGWIALRGLGQPVVALAHFQRFNASVGTPISLGRGGYWLGRAYEAMGDPANASEWYRTAAAHQTSFYGQLAAAKLGAAGEARIASGELPDWEKSPALRSDDVRAGVLLHYAGEHKLAFLMFSHLGRRMEGAAALGALARLGLELGQPHYAVRVAKHAARRGILIYPAYYPVTELAGYASKIEPALAMSIARLGQSYLAEQILTFGGSYVLAAVAYNAGPHRVDRWIGAYGDPRLPGTDMIDWIETIPFGETRNYVQRVIEGLYVYRARLSGTAGPMTIGQDLARGVR